MKKSELKERISATVDKKTLELIENILEGGFYRNKSHLIEESIKLLEKNAKKK